MRIICKRASRNLSGWGFTLLEVAIAVAIFATAMVVLVSLQATALSRAVSDRDQTHAMLIAREILSAIEKFQFPIKEQDTTAAPIEILSQFVAIPPSDTSSGEIVRDDNRFTVRLTVEPWQIEAIPFIPPGAVQRVRILVFWSDNPDHSLEVLYFIRPHSSAGDPDDEESDTAEGDNTEDDQASDVSDETGEEEP